MARRQPARIQARKSRGGRSGPLGTKPLKEAAGGETKRIEAGAVAVLSLAGIGRTDASAHAAQCSQSACVEGVSGWSGSWHPAIIPPAIAIGSAVARSDNTQPSMAADAKACSGRASISTISRNRWK